VTEQLVPCVATVVSPATLYAALRGAWAGLLGAQPSRQSLLVLVAHWALETGWGHSCWNWNLGNVKHVDGDGRDFYSVRCNEVIAGKVVWIEEGQPGSFFRAFAGLAEGAADYLRLLHGQFGFAWPAVEAGDPAGFCHALRQRGYFTADEATYTRGVVACMASADHVIPPDPDTAQLAIEAEAQAMGGFVPGKGDG
jgi:hypothetical protein